ncbi:ATPase-activating ribosome biosynthesis protein, partial [Cryomyces antarcticus]
AMQRVSEIRARRERVFYKNRMQGNRQKQREADRKLVEENQHLLPPAEREVAKELLEREKEDMEVEGEEEEKVEKKVKGAKVKRRQRLLVGQGPEDMDVDG